jgi:hypothetical protein
MAGMDRVSIGEQAAVLGHHVAVERDGKRFRLRCSCGVVTAVNWKRKTTFDWMTEHIAAVVRVAHQDPPDGVTLHGSAYPS